MGDCSSWSNTSPLSSAPITRQSSELSLHIHDDTSPILDAAIKNIDLILSNQTKALSFLTEQYRNSKFSITEMKKSLRFLNNSLKLGGKIVISGMGKSFKIASKTVATLNSLRMHSALLHPSEALHGDLGMIREDHNDALIIISASGNSPELLQMIEHVPFSVPIILMTCTKNSVLSKHLKVVSLMLAEIPSSISETNLYGLSAPTISTTLCLTLLDSVSIALSELHINDYKMRKLMFKIHHPGGAIGINYRKNELKEIIIDNDVKGKENTGNEHQNGLEHSTEKENEGETEKGTGNGNEEGICNEACPAFNTQHLELAANSKFTTYVDLFPEIEETFLRLVTLHDYVIIRKNNNSKEIENIMVCENARHLYRQCISAGDSWSETRWKLQVMAGQ